MKVEREVIVAKRYFKDGKEGKNDIRNLTLTGFGFSNVEFRFLDEELFDSAIEGEKYNAVFELEEKLKAGDYGKMIWGFMPKLVSLTPKN